jgi:hypothetical protein
MSEKIMTDEQLEQHRQVAMEALRQAQHPLADSVSQMLLESGRMRSEMQEIKHAIVGNPAMGHRGLVGRVDALEGKVENLDGLVKKGGGAVIGVTAVVELLRHFKLVILAGALVVRVVWLAGCRTVEPVLLTDDKMVTGGAEPAGPVKE